MQEEEKAIERMLPWFTAAVMLEPYAVLAQSTDVPWTQTVWTLLNNVTHVIAPAIGICGFIAVGVSFLMGETGRIFKIAIGVVVGATLIAKAQDIWTGLFGGIAANSGG